MKIKILGHKIPVVMRTQEALTKDHRDSKEQNVYGAYVEMKRRIELSKDLDSETQKRVLLHEIQHSLLSLSGMTNTLENGAEEALCDLAENWLEIFRDKTFRKLIK